MDIKFTKSDIIINLSYREYRELVTGMKNTFIINGVTANDDRRVVLKVETEVPVAVPTKDQKAVELLTGKVDSQASERKDNDSIGSSMVSEGRHQSQRHSGRSQGYIIQSTFSKE